MKTGISIVICCYNSESRIGKTLQVLSGLKTTGGYPWEVVLVDNNSTDNTGGVARKVWQQVSEPVPLIVLKENNPGLSFARKRGAREAHYAYLVYCDDDNWLAENYLDRVLDIFFRELPYNRNYRWVCRTGL